jgi:acid phosphatase
VVTKDYRVLLNIGDNFGDFTIATHQRGRSRQGLRFRHGLLGQAVADDRQSDLRPFDTSTCGHDFKKPLAEQRKAKWDILESWVGPKP